MFHKWSVQEDSQLRRLVLLHATDWHKIEETFSSKRSRNALIKRWHTKLKNMTDAATDTKSDLQMMEEEKSPVTDNTFILQSNFQMEIEHQKSRQWTQIDDSKLRSLVLDLHQYDWQVLAKNLNVTQTVVQKNWQQRIYPVIKSLRKIAGALMWTKQEDNIIFHAIKKSNYKWQNLLVFLPGRSYFSLQARWKRISARTEVPKKNIEQNFSKIDIRAINHQRRLKEYKNILKLRKSPLQRLSERSCKQESHQFH